LSQFKFSICIAKAIALLEIAPVLRQTDKNSAHWCLCAAIRSK